MRNLFLHSFQFIKDILFPVFCIECNLEGTLLCQKCSFFLPRSGIYLCPVCRADAPLGRPCVTCQSLTPLSFHVALGVFEENNLLGKLIYSYKYNFLDDAMIFFDRSIKEFIEKNKSIFSEVQIIIPVPLHRRRFAERGFNQAEKIGESVSRYLSLPLENRVKRKRATRQQAKLGRNERLQNLHDAFVLEKNIVAGKNILLIDDVLTTGSTLNECAKILREAGAHDVSAFTLARG